MAPADSGDPCRRPAREGPAPAGLEGTCRERHGRVDVCLSRGRAKSSEVLCLAPIAGDDPAALPAPGAPRGPTAAKKRAAPPSSPKTLFPEEVVVGWGTYPRMWRKEGARKVYYNR